MSMTVGIAGTGRMGTAFTRRLIDTGHGVQVWNRTSENARSAVDAGAALTGEYCRTECLRNNHYFADRC